MLRPVASKYLVWIFIAIFAAQPDSTAFYLVEILSTKLAAIVDGIDFSILYFSSPTVNPNGGAIHNESFHAAVT